jgi:hypothetical protein
MKPDLFSDVVVAQHRLVFRRMDGLRRGARLQRSAARFAKVLLAHSLAEREVVDPLEPDRSLRARDEDEHDVLTYALSRVLGSPVIAHTFEARLHTLRTLLVHHCEREERARLPALEERVGISRSRRVAARLQARFAALEALDLESLVASAASTGAVSPLSARAVRLRR